MSRFRMGGWLLLLAALSCNQVAPNNNAAPSASAPSPAPAVLPSAGEPAALASADHYSVPFAWQASDDEPLARVRDFLGEATQTNGEYAREHPREFFDGLREAQTPRATVVMCSDSRVHSNSFDASPENDVFIIRNIGNNLGVSAGSVEYGVRHLHTPLLLIVGHTGCGAVQAALAARNAQGHGVEPDIERELSALFLDHSSPVRPTPKRKAEESDHDDNKDSSGKKDKTDDKDSSGKKDKDADAAKNDSKTGSKRPPPKSPEEPRKHPAPRARSLSAEDQAWLGGVVANVDGQVRVALEKYGRELAQGDLVVVGAVYDLRNDMGLGYGQLVIVNVNGNTDPQRIQPFLDAVGAAGSDPEDRPRGKERAGRDSARSGMPDETVRAIRALEALAAAEAEAKAAKERKSKR